MRGGLALVHLVSGIGAGGLYVFQAAHEGVDCGSFLDAAQRPQILLGAVASRSRLRFLGMAIFYTGTMLLLRVEFALLRGISYRESAAFCAERTCASPD